MEATSQITEVNSHRERKSQGQSPQRKNKMQFIENLNTWFLHI